MTAPSIPERAREIAEKYAFVYEPDNEVIDNVVEALTEMAHSERELCAKELEARAEEAREEVAEYRKEGMTDGYLIHAAVNEVENYTNATKLLRETEASK